MSRESVASTVVPRALDEHARILPVLAQMARSARWLDATDPDPKVFDRVLGQMQELRTELQEHFDAEDRSRLHPRLLALVPDAETEVGRLEEEHRSVLHLLDEAATRAMRCSPLHVERLRVDLEAVLALLFDHEAIEDQLMARAFDPRAS